MIYNTPWVKSCLPLHIVFVFLLLHSLGFYGFFIFKQTRIKAITKSEGFQYGIIYQEKETGPELKSEAQFYGENVPGI